jgi:hypothetical protein
MQILEYEQALFHSYLPIPKTLIKMINFCKFDYLDLPETNLKFLKFFLLIK